MATALVAAWVLLGVGVYVAAEFTDVGWPIIGHVRDLEFSDENPRLLYLLSGFGQALAAIVALVFTLSLVMTQLTARYSLRMVDVQTDSWTKAFITGFIVAALLPFIALYAEGVVLAHLSLWYGSLCVLLLLPYLLHLMRSTTSQAAIDSCLRQFCCAFPGNVAHATDAILKIEAIEKYAIKEEDFAVLGQANEALILAAQWQEEVAVGDMSVLDIDLIQRSIKRVVKDTWRDTRVYEEAFAAYERAIQSAVKQQRRYGVHRSLLELEIMGTAAVNLNRTSVLGEIVQCLCAAGGLLATQEGWREEGETVLKGVQDLLMKGSERNFREVGRGIHYMGILMMKTLECGFRAEDWGSWNKRLLDVTECAAGKGKAFAPAGAYWTVQIGGWGFEQGVLSLAEDCCRAVRKWQVELSEREVAGWIEECPRPGWAWSIDPHRKEDGRSRLFVRKYLERPW